MTTAERIARILNVHVTLVEMLMTAQGGDSLTLQYPNLWVKVSQLEDLEDWENGE